MDKVLKDWRKVFNENDDRLPDKNEVERFDDRVDRQQPDEEGGREGGRGGEKKGRARG